MGKKRTHKILSSPEATLTDALAPVVSRLETILANKPIPPKTDGTPYPYIIDDNGLEFPNMAFFSHGQFAVFGCSCLRTIEAAFKAIDFNAYEYSVNGYNNVPKLFIADNSLNVMRLWSALKQQVGKHETLEGFLESVEGSFFEESNIQFEPSDSSYFIGKVLELCKSDEDYKLFKAMIQKATVMCMDWLDERAMQFVKAHNTQPLVVHASNIHELLPYTKGLPEIDTYVRNIGLLNPAYTLYTRTSLTYARKIRGSACPDNVDIVIGERQKSHKKTLCQAYSLMSLLTINHTSENKDEFLARTKVLFKKNDKMQRKTLKKMK